MQSVAGTISRRLTCPLPSYFLSYLLVRFHRAGFTAAFLLFVGVLFSTLGLSFLFTLGLNDALPFLIIGGIGQHSHKLANSS